MAQEVKITSNTTLEDLIFEGRNKEYGAYFLRQIYGKTARTSALIGVAVVTLGLVGPMLYSKYKPLDEKKKVTLANPMDVPPPPMDETQPPPPPPPPPPPEAPKPVSTTKFLPPEIKPDEEVKQEEPPPTQETLKDAQASSETVVGDPNATEVVIDPNEGKAKVEVVEVKPVTEEIFTVVEQQASFPGGAEALGKFLLKNLKYPPEAQRANVQGKVFMSFVVSPDGSISDVNVLKGLGFGCDQEATRVVKSMPRWAPGKQSGRAVKSRFTLPITFQLE
ncbi:MAG: TonB family protein [Sphingobacteriaceae bacterium]|nr:TonB family protein [Cytophagaceae bacterium]